MSPELLKNNPEQEEGQPDRSELDSAINERLYGSLPPGDQGPGEEPVALHEAAQNAAGELGINLDEDPNRPTRYNTVRKSYEGKDFAIKFLKERPDGELERPDLPLKIIEYPPQPINYGGVVGMHRLKLVETAPGSWSAQIENEIYRGDESALPAEFRTSTRDTNGDEARIAYALLNDPTIDPEKQKSLDAKQQSHGEIVSPAAESMPDTPMAA